VPYSLHSLSLCPIRCLFSLVVRRFMPSKLCDTQPQGCKHALCVAYAEESWHVLSPYHIPQLSCFYYASCTPLNVCGAAGSSNAHVFAANRPQRRPLTSSFTVLPYVRRIVRATSTRMPQSILSINLTPSHRFRAYWLHAERGSGKGNILCRRHR